MPEHAGASAHATSRPAVPAGPAVTPAMPRHAIVAARAVIESRAARTVGSRADGSDAIGTRVVLAEIEDVTIIVAGAIADPERRKWIAVERAEPLHHRR